MTTHEDARSLRGWTPVRFFQRDDGQPAVEWLQFGEERFNAPFFLQTVRDARDRNFPRWETPAEVLSELAQTSPDLPLSGLIFHLTRCGSTLVTQMLAALTANVVLSEPEPIDEILRSDRWLRPADSSTRTGWLSGLVHAWGVRRFPEERRLFLKLDPWHVLDLATIRAAYPGVPTVFLYRDPVEILVSQSDNMAGTLFSGDNGPARLGLTPADAAGMTADEYCARVLGTVAEAMATAAENDPGITLVAYPELPLAVETIIAPLFGLTPTDEDAQQMRQTARFHAKAPGQQVFREDSARKQGDADEEQRALAARWIGPAYARLEALRAARRA